MLARAIRADDIYKSGLIINDIARSIEEASVIIADITTDNPNVFYEVGYAHGIKKETILLSDRTRETLPFDVAGFRTLFYDNTSRWEGCRRSSADDTPEKHYGLKLT